MANTKLTFRYWKRPNIFQSIIVAILTQLIAIFQYQQMWFISILRRKQVNVIYQKASRRRDATRRRLQYRTWHSYLGTGIHIASKAISIFIYNNRSFGENNQTRPAFKHRHTFVHRIYRPIPNTNSISWYFFLVALASSKWKDEWPFCTVRYHFKRWENSGVRARSFYAIIIVWHY